MWRRRQQQVDVRKSKVMRYSNIGAASGITLYGRKLGFECGLEYLVSLAHVERWWRGNEDVQVYEGGFKVL